MALNLSAEEPVTQEDWEELNFSDVRTFLRYVEAALNKVYNSIIRLCKHLVLLNKQNKKLKSKFTNYKKANKVYVIDNAQLKTENNDLENWLASLEKQLEIIWSDKHPAPSPPPLLLVISNNLDDNLKQSKKTKLTKLLDLSMLTNGHATRFDINVWESKMIKKLSANVNHYPTKALHIIYVDSHINGKAYKHLAARSKIGAWKLFTTAKKIFEVL